MAVSSRRKAWGCSDPPTLAAQARSVVTSNGSYEKGNRDRSTRGRLRRESATEMFNMQKELHVNEIDLLDGII
jgi:hypothetical protein